MFQLPPEFSGIISVFSPLFSKKIFERVGQLLLGAILTQGKRTVCGILRTLGLGDITNWDLYHRVLSRAKWSTLECAKKLLKLLIKRFVPTKTLVFGMDETLERRWGMKIKARGIYRDAVRSSKSHFVKCSGLRWICVMLLTPISWANRIWALPFLSVLAPSERYHLQIGKSHKTVSDWARQIFRLLRRWLPDFEIIMVADGSYAVMELLADVPSNAAWIVRFRMDARLHDFPPPYAGFGRPPEKGQRQPSLQSRLEDPNSKWQKVRFSKWYNEDNKQMEIASGTALWYRAGKPLVALCWIILRDPQGKLDPITIACTDLSLEPFEIVGHYLKRWPVEVTFEEVRAHLGVETQRQWADLSILRSTPCLMALFSIITLWADYLNQINKLTTFQTAWYVKTYPTFSDAVASIRYRIWQFQLNSHSAKNEECQINQTKLMEHLAFMAARAA